MTALLPISGHPIAYEQRTARIAGVWFILTFLFSIPALLLYAPVLDNAAYVLDGGADTRISFGALLEILLVIANIATAVVLFPVLKRHNEAIALGYVTLRVVEGMLITVGIVSLLAVVTLSQNSTGADAGALTVAGQSLVAIHDWTFLLGPQFCAGFGTGILLGYLMYRSGLVPRRMALLALIGGPLAFAAGVGVLFGAYEQVSPITFLLTIPEILWEASLGIYLVVRGFKTLPTAPETPAQAAGAPRVPLLAN